MRFPFSAKWMDSGPVDERCRYVEVNPGVLLLCATPLALAVARDDAGKGQVLLFPFFTTENDWDTYINIVLLSEANDEVLKVRVLDGVDGNVVNTFNVYAKVGENWRAALAQVEAGKPILRVAEGSCTIAADGAFGGRGTDFPLNTATGLIEIYRVSVRRAAGSNVLSDSSCEELAARWAAGGAWAVAPGDGLVVDATQPEIIGHFDLVNVLLGLSSEQPAIGLRDFSAFIPHTAPDAISPNLADAEPVARLSSGQVVVPDSGEGIDAIALLLSTKEEGTITNDVVLSTEVAARTDWIVSFPLRGYKEYGDYEVEIDGEMRTCNEKELHDGPPPYFEKPLRSPWSSWGGGPGIRVWDDLDPTPMAKYSPFLCYSANVLTFGDSSPVLLPSDSLLQETLDIGGSSLEFPSESFAVSYRFADGLSAPTANDGRPVVAYRVTTFVNGTLNGGSVLANYMFMRPHIVQ